MWVRTYLIKKFQLPCDHWYIAGFMPIMQNKICIISSALLVVTHLFQNAGIEMKLGKPHKLQVLRNEDFCSLKKQSEHLPARTQYGFPTAFYSTEHFHSPFSATFHYSNMIIERKELSQDANSQSPKISPSAGHHTTLLPSTHLLCCAWFTFLLLTKWKIKGNESASGKKQLPPPATAAIHSTPL